MLKVNYCNIKCKIHILPLIIKITNVTEEYICSLLIPEDRERRFLRNAGKDLSHPHGITSPTAVIFQGTNVVY